MSLYTVYEKKNYDYRGNDIFTIECTYDEIKEVVNELNVKNDRFNGATCGSIGSPNYFDYRIAGLFFKSVEEYTNFIAEQKIKQMEILASKRSYCVDNWR
jgi:hypothetical protein